MAWNRPTQKIESESKAAKSSRVWWGLGAGLIVAVAAVAGVVSFTAGEGRPRPEKAVAGEEVAEEVPKPKQTRTIREVKPAVAPTYNVVAEKLQGCKFLVNGQVKQKAKFYLCLFSASWCGPCRREMPRIAKAYAETLKDDPDIELIHFSRDQNDEKAMAWAKEHDVKFPVVKPNGGNPLDLHSRGIPHLFIVKADGTVLEEGHPMRIFNEEKFSEIKSGNVKPRDAERAEQCQQACETTTNGVKWSYKIVDGGVVFKGGYCSGAKLAVPQETSGALVIPDKLGGYPVRSIDEAAFRYCRRLTSVTIPSTVTSIKGNPFSGCSGIESFVVSPDSILYICSEQMYMAAEFPSLSDCPGEIAAAADGEQKCRETVSYEVGCRV